MIEKDKILQDTRQRLDEVKRENEKLKSIIAVMKKQIEKDKEIIKAIKEITDIEDMV